MRRDQDNGEGVIPNSATTDIPYTALITGASSGLGYELSKAIYPYVDRLIITGRSQERLRAVKNELVALFPNKKSSSIESIVYDFSAPLKGSDLVASFDSGLPHILINNAGFGWYGRFLHEPFLQQARIMEVNVTRTMELTHEWSDRVSKLASNHYPYSLCFISSMAAFMPIPGMAAYAASKAALLSFAEAIRTEFHEMNVPISVLTVCPGQFRTGFQKLAAHKVDPFSDLQDRTSFDALILSEKIIHKILQGKQGVYIPSPWRIQKFLMKFLPEEFLKRTILKRLLTRIDAL